MINPLIFSPHTLLLQVEPNIILLYQSLLRKGVLVDNNSLAALVHNQSDNLLNKPEEVKMLDVSCFSLANCLLDNPAGIQLTPPMVLNTRPWEDLITLLKNYYLISENETYVTKQGKMNNLFDRDHIGNFHQQIGYFLFKDRRGNPENWWIEQKFESDISQPRDTPYRWVQQEFMNNYFSEDFAGFDLLDFGCGVGFYSAFFGQKKMNVLGVDPSSLYISIAQKKFSNFHNVQFLKQNFEKKSDFNIFNGKRFDRIFLSDVLLYYFEPYKPIDLTATELLSQLREHLKPAGRIYIMDPHGCFHLQPWLGCNTPYLVSTEYANRKYRVTPTLEEFSRAVEKAGLVIQKIREPISTGSAGQNQAKNITREFPLWWFFELSSI